MIDTILKRILSVSLAFLMILTFALIVDNTIHAQGALELSIGHPISKWILNEDANHLYVTVPKLNQLLFIDTNNLRIKNTFNLAGPNNMVLHEGSLYVTNNSNSQVVVVNPTSQKVTGSFHLRYQPQSITIKGNFLLYTAATSTNSPDNSQPNPLTIYTYNILSGEEKTINKLK